MASALPCERFRAVLMPRTLHGAIASVVGSVCRIAVVDVLVSAVFVCIASTGRKKSSKGPTRTDLEMSGAPDIDYAKTHWDAGGNELCVKAPVHLASKVCLEEPTKSSDRQRCLQVRSPTMSRQWKIAQRCIPPAISDGSHEILMVTTVWCHVMPF